jgi:hypothetical protein
VGAASGRPTAALPPPSVHRPGHLWAVPFGRGSLEMAGYGDYSVLTRSSRASRWAPWVLIVRCARADHPKRVPEPTWRSRWPPRRSVHAARSPACCLPRVDRPTPLIALPRRGRKPGPSPRTHPVVARMTSRSRRPAHVPVSGQAVRVRPWQFQSCYDKDCLFSRTCRCVSGR